MTRKLCEGCAVNPEECGNDPLATGGDCFTNKPKTLSMREHMAIWLKDQGYDGVYCDECVCFLDNLAPCSDCMCECMPGYKVKVEFGGELVDGISSVKSAATDED